MLAVDSTPSSPSTSTIPHVSFRAEVDGALALMLNTVGDQPGLWCAHHTQAVQPHVELRPWEHLVLA